MLLLIKISKESKNLDMAFMIHVAFSADPDEMLHYAVSHLGLQYLKLSHL